MKATRILIAQHRAIEALFQELARETRRQARARWASRLTEELIAHMAGEEAIFYPAVRRVLGEAVGPSERPGAIRSGASRGGVSPIEGPSSDPHLMLRAQLRRVLATRVQEPAFEPRSEALRLLFAHHVEAEEAEETGVFPRVEAALADSQLETLGADVLGSRPPIWAVTTEGHALLRSSKARGVRLPAVR
jgi:hemerythrin superfamily protein